MLLLEPCPGSQCEDSRSRMKPFRRKRHPDRRKVGLVGFRRLGLDWAGRRHAGGWRLEQVGRSVSGAATGTRADEVSEQQLEACVPPVSVLRAADPNFPAEVPQQPAAPASPRVSMLDNPEADPWEQDQAQFDEPFMAPPDAEWPPGPMLSGHWL